ncbi:FAD-binding oxidoreductase [Aureimonas sp. OT7]|uniref:FAD-binding oxidoreductase n=1 Tax=Aureimonas sp. OT7 TaxID=2816454 RepID=UPI0017832668|nr:FAD-binding oxidoreductase [Aureimonas sp. OT7]QOG07126.1 FAD-binding oxidoreductase [Aureimonas sp. OT7]
MTDFETWLDYTSWGRVVRAPQRVAKPRFSDEIAALLRPENKARTLAVGQRRSYGDSNINSAGNVIDMTGIDRLIDFDQANGFLRCDAGIRLIDILRVTVPAGWFPSTTPGTWFATVGGCIANDVHGKNHHRAGSFGCGVEALDLLTSDGVVTRVEQGSPLFLATVGGLGLTGVILAAELKLTPIKSAYLSVTRTPFANVEEFLSVAADNASSEHTVAWVDCTASGNQIGRGIFQSADWLADQDFSFDKGLRRRSMPFDWPAGVLNRYSVAAFNKLYYRIQKAAPSPQRTHFRPFFYPLDTIDGWNRMYGARGFYQYQCVLPNEAAGPGLTELLQCIFKVGAGSFLAVLKSLGQRSSGGLLSFPMEGVTLALDFANHGPATLHLMAQLDEIVLASGGRLYPAKDGRMPARVFQSGYSRWREFARFVDPGADSNFWTRVSRA